MQGLTSIALATFAASSNSLQNPGISDQYLFDQKFVSSPTTKRLPYLTSGIPLVSGTMSAPFIAKGYQGLSSRLFACESLSASNEEEFLEMANPLAQSALNQLIEGNKRFLAGELKNYQAMMMQVKSCADGQSPHSAIVSCMDSRTSADMVFDQRLGEIFSLRVAGNVINPHILGSLEYACEHVGTPLIVVMGHTGCGAVKGALAMAAATKNEETGESHLANLLQEIMPAIEAAEAAEAEEVAQGAASVDREAQQLRNAQICADVVAKHNVFESMKAIRSESKVLDQMLTEGRIDMVGAMYDVRTGSVDFFERK